MTLVMSLVTPALSGGAISHIRCWGTRKLSAGPLGDQWSDIGLGWLAGVSLPSDGGWSRMHFCLVQLQEELPVRALARAGDRYPLAGESGAAGASPELGALPSPWPVLPREQSTCLPQTFLLRGCVDE